MYELEASTPVSEYESRIAKQALIVRCNNVYANSSPLKGEVPGQDELPCTYKPLALMITFP